MAQQVDQRHIVISEHQSKHVIFNVRIKSSRHTANSHKNGRPAFSHHSRNLSPRLISSLAFLLLPLPTYVARGVLLQSKPDNAPILLTVKANFFSVAHLTGPLLLLCVFFPSSLCSFLSRHTGCQECSHPRAFAQAVP